MMRYEFATLAVALGTIGKAAEAVQAFCAAAGAGGRLLGCWSSEIGPLNQLAVLRGFASDAELAAERERTLASGSPFGCADFLHQLTLESYAPFPFLPPVEPGAYGPVYEIRVYGLKPSGLAPTIEAWRAAVGPRGKLSRLTMAMYALDGAVPRFLHIWPYANLDERSRIRTAAVEQGVWPPAGGPPHLTVMCSTIYLPVAGSPLR